MSNRVGANPTQKPPALIHEGVVNVIRCGAAWSYDNRTDRVVAAPWACDPKGSSLALAPGQSWDYPIMGERAWEHFDWGIEAQSPEGECNGK